MSTNHGTSVDRFLAASGLACAALVVSAPGMARAQCPWNLASAGVPTVPGDPPVRQNHMAVFDSIRNVVFMYGGAASGVSLGDSWTWNGATWSLASTTGPSARSVHAMAWDPVRGVVVMFGGNAGGALGDTWEWNGAAWTQVFPTASPPARYNHAMAYDTIRNRVVLTGGFSTLRYNDTWEYNGTTWTQRTEPGFTNYVARSSHAMEFDPARNKMVIFGGFGGAPVQRLADTWEMGPTGWTQIAVSGPTGRQYTGGFAYDPVGQKLYLFGGQVGATSQERANDLWTYNGTWTQVFAGSVAPNPVAPGTPYRRDQHATVWDRARNKLVIFGGYQGSGLGGVVGDTWTTSCTSPCYPNCDASTVSPILTANDFTCFLNSFIAGNTYANCDGSTVDPVLNANDFTCFLNAYTNGCT